MSNNESIASIATERLTAPGVVDRGPVLRHYDRLQHPLPSSALAERLQQRAAHAEHADGSALIWQRASITPNAVVSEPPPKADVGHATTPSVDQPSPSDPPSTDIGHATTPSIQQPPVQSPVSPAAQAGATATRTLVQRLAQRKHAPGAVTVADNIRHANPESAAIASDSLTQQVHARYGVEKGAPLPVGRTAVATATPSSPVVVMRQADPTINRRAQPTPTSLPIGIARKHEASASPANRVPAASAQSAPLIAPAPSSLSAATPLVLQRVAAPVATLSATPAAPYSMPSSSAVAEELTRAAHAEQPASAPHVTTAAHSGNSDIGRLAEEVERRLRLRLEIERERRGIRSWR